MEELCLRYGLPVVNGAGVGYDGSRVHGPDEHIRLEDFLLNIKLILLLLTISWFSDRFGDADCTLE